DDISEGMFHLSSDGALVDGEEELPEPMVRRAQGVIEGIPWLSRSYLFAEAMEGIRAGQEQWANLWIKADAASSRSEELTYKLVEQILVLAKSRQWSVIMLVFELEQRQE